MFHSTHVFTGETIYRRPAQSYTEFTDELNRLQTLQQTFAQSSIIERTALLQQFADSLTQNQERLAEMVCEEVGRCLHECRAEISKSIELIRYYVRLAPELLAHKTIATQASLSQVRFEPLGVVWRSCRGTTLFGRFYDLPSLPSVPAMPVRSNLRPVSPASAKPYSALSQKVCRLSAHG